MRINRLLCIFGLAASVALLNACEESGPQSWQLADGRPAGAAVVFYSGRDIFDQSFNEAIFRAVEEYQSTTNLPFRHVAARPQDILHDIDNMMQKEPAVVVGIGFLIAQLIEDIAPKYPDIRFVVIDHRSKHNNVLSVSFREEEAMFLAGILAALKSDSQKLGFIGGMDIPVIHKMACAYLAGARTVSEDMRVVYGVVGDTPKAWEDAVTPVALSRVLYNRGARVMVVAAGSSNSTIHQMYHGNTEVYTIAVDINSNFMAPGSILTSFVKETGGAVVDVLNDVRMGLFQPGHQTKGLKEEGVDVSFDKYNDTLIDETMRTRVAEARDGIINHTLHNNDLVPENCESYMDRVHGTDPDVQEYIDF